MYGHDTEREAETVANECWQHTSGELRDIAAVLDGLNGIDSDLAFSGELTLYWCDRPQGYLRQDDPGDSKSWVYQPAVIKDAVEKWDKEKLLGEDKDRLIAAYCGEGDTDGQ